MKGIGRQIQIGFAKEAVRGTAEAAATYWLPFIDVAIDERDQKVINEQAMGVIEDSLDQKIVLQWAEASLKANIGDKTFPLLLLATLGSLSSASNPDAGGTVKDHTITVAQSAQHQSLTTFLDDPIGGADYKHALSVVENLELNYERGKYVNYAIKLRAKKGATATNTPATTAESYFLPQHLTFKLAADLAGLTAATPLVIKGLKLKISKDIDNDDVLGSITPADFVNRKLSIEGELEAIWQNETDFKTFVLAGTAKAMRIDLKNSDVTIGSAANPQLTIDLAKVIFTELTRGIKIDDLIHQTLKFKAHYSAADSKMITAKATNLVASY